MKRLRNILLLSALTLLNVACQSPTTNSQANDAQTTTVSAQDAMTTVSTEEKDEAKADAEGETTTKEGRSVTIRSIGDILIHDWVYDNAATADGYDFTPMFEPIKKYLENADITTANLEVIAAGDTYPLSTYPAFNAPSEIIDALKTVGVDIVNNATNHSMDLGAEGAYASIEALKERDMPYVGSYESWDDYNNMRVLDANGVKVGFLSYSYGANGNYIPEDQAYLLSLIDTDLMPLEVEALNKISDISVVMIHNGEEYDALPSVYQANVNNVVRNAGANFILGGHPHLPQPFIVYNKHQAAMFSHGNFLSGQVEQENKVGGIAEYTFTEVDGEFEISKIRFMPTYCIGAQFEDYYVVPLADWEQYGIYNGDGLFADLEERMTYYSNLVEVVDYLD